MSWGDIWGRSKHMRPVSANRRPETSVPSWGPRGNTATSSTDSGEKMPAQLPKVGGRPERGPVGGGCPVMSSRGSGKSARQFRKDFDIPAAESPCLLQPSTPQSMLGKKRSLWSRSPTKDLFIIACQLTTVSWPLCRLKALPSCRSCILGKDGV